MDLHIDSQGQGPDVVLLHGWGMNGAVWRDVAATLADEFCVHSVDLPGHGRSDSISPYTLAGLASSLRSAFPYPVTVVGWSLGGAVASRWALDAPDSVRALVLVASSPCFMQRADWLPAMPEPVLRQFAAQLAADYRATLRRFLGLQVLGSQDARQQLQRLHDDLLAGGEPQPDILGAGLALLAETDLRPELPQLSCPAQLHFGQRDGLTRQGAGDWLARCWPHADYQLYPDAAHAPFLSHREAFCASLRAFLQRV